MRPRYFGAVAVFDTRIGVALNEGGKEPKGRGEVGL